MEHSTARWTTWVATVGLIALPIITTAQTPSPAPQPAPAPTEQPKQAPQPAPPEQPKQTPQPTPPEPTQQPPTEQPTAPRPQSEMPQHSAHSAQEHLRQAKAALGDIQDTAVAGAARTHLTELRRHLSALERTTMSPDQPNAQTRARRGTRQMTQSWATEVAAIDRVITQMVGPAAATGTGTPPATTGTAGKAGSKGEAAVTVDDATRAKLMEVRTHITAFAAAMSGTEQPSSAQTGEQTTPTANAAMAQPSTATSTQPPAAAPAQSPATSPQPSTTPTAQPGTTTSTQPPAATQPTPTEPTTTQPPAAQTAQTQTAAQPAAVDAEASKRHLTAARDTLSQLTQLPEAAQLSGEVRTQVTQLIANFNELITTQSQWRASFTKVQENLTALLGAERTDEANVPPPAAGTPGAVGTSGMASLDAKVREKLVEFRKNLNEFEKAAGGASAGR